MKSEPDMLLESATNVRARRFRKWKRHTIGSAAVACALLLIPYAQAQTSPLAARLNVLPTIPGNSFQFGVTGVPGWNYAIQASTDQVNWVTLQTNASPFTFVDTNSAALPQRFYRAVPIIPSPQGATITSQPTSLCQTQGGNAAFSVGATGTGPLSYQWQFDGSNIRGAVTSSLALANVQPTESGSYCVVVTGTNGSATSASADLAVLSPTGAIMDLNFGPTPTGAPKTGFAATGLTTNDYWNPYIYPNQTSVTISNLLWSDQSASSVDMTVLNAPGQWNNSTGDPMYDSFIYPWDGGSVTVILTNLPAGDYYFYCYGHSQLDQDNTVFQIRSGGYASATEQTTASHLAATSDVWVEGLQYVVFRNVPVTNGQSVTITASPGSGVAILNGIQIVPLVSPPPQGPAITSQPTSLCQIQGGNAAFSVGAVGTGPLSYQWQFNGRNIRGAVTSSLALVHVHPAESGSYRVVVTGPYGSVTSASADLTVLRRKGAIMDLNFGPPPSGVPKTGLAATGLTTNDYWNPYVYPNQTSVTISNLLWSDQSSSSVDMTVLNAPGQWYNSTGDSMYDSFIYPWNGGSVTVVLTNLPAGNYCFYCYGHSQLDQDDTVFQVRSGSYASATEQTTASHLAATSDLWAEGLQYVVFRNVPVTTGQSVTITASPGSGVAILNGIQIIPLAGHSPQGPTITSQPTSLCQTQGGNATFTVGAVGTRPLRYQWKFNGNNIRGAVTSSLSLVNVQPAESGSYSVTVTGRYGSVTSASADLTVLSPNGAIMDLNFGPTPTGGPKTGFAATGLTTNDYWNPYIHPNQTSVTISNLLWSDQSASTVDMTVLNAPGQWNNSTGDLMYDSFIYPWDGGSVTAILTNLPVGNYYFYCYGHSQLDQDNTVFQVRSGSYASATEQTTASHLAATSDVWVEGLQYVVFRNVPVATGQSVIITASPGSGVAILNGIQIIHLAAP